VKEIRIIGKQKGKICPLHFLVKFKGGMLTPSNIGRVTILGPV
jgi:hypothetical protein